MFSPTLLRYIFTGYLIRTSIVMLTLLTVALAIDLQANQKQVLSVGELEGLVDTALRLIWYVSLRAVDIVSRLLGIAAFLGVFWSEFSHNRSRERVAVWNCGVSPFGAMATPLLFGIFLVGVQAALEFWVRPAAVSTQVESGLGSYGERYGRADSGKTVWFVAGSDLVAARINHGPPIALNNLVVYRISETNRLLGVVTAASAHPTSRSGIWSLNGAQEWTVDPSVDKLNVGKASVRLETPLAVDPEWLRYRTMPARYLPQKTIVRLARQNAIGTRQAEYKTWVIARYTKSLMPALFVMLAFSVGVFSFGRPATLPMFMLYFPSGYLLNILVKNCIPLAEFGEIPPIATLVLPIAMTIVIMAILLLPVARCIHFLSSALRPSHNRHPGSTPRLN